VVYRLCVLSVLLAGCLPPPSPTTALPTKAAPGTAPGTHAGGPVTGEEEEVARRCAEQTDDPGTIEWIEWGPHDLAGETHDHDPATYKLIRVRWRGTHTRGRRYVRDAVFVVRPGRRVKDVGSANVAGARWMEAPRWEKQERDKARRQGGP
jgi:hypothetical protein